jgi:hypothetical protein
MSLERVLGVDYKARKDGDHGFQSIREIRPGKKSRSISLVSMWIKRREH